MLPYIFAAYVALKTYASSYYVQTFFPVQQHESATPYYIVVVVVVVLFTLTDRASTIPSNIRGCQSGTWSAGHKSIRGTSTKLQREQTTQQNKTKTTKERNNTKIHAMTIPLLLSARSKLHGLMGEARLLGLEGEIKRRVGRGAPYLPVSCIEELLLLYVRAFCSQEYVHEK